MSVHTVAEVERRYPGELLLDDFTAVLTQRVLDELDVYETSLPTGPSTGRLYRNGRYVYVVENDPDHEGYQLHRPHLAVVA